MCGFFLILPARLTGQGAKGGAEKIGIGQKGERTKKKANVTCTYLLITLFSSPGKLKIRCLFHFADRHDYIRSLLALCRRVWPAQSSPRSFSTSSMLSVRPRLQRAHLDRKEEDSPKLEVLGRTLFLNTPGNQVMGDTGGCFGIHVKYRSETRVG